MAQIFTISDGTTTIDLLSPNGPYYLASYETGLNQWKDGGIFTENQLAEGSIPVFRQFDSFEEKLSIHITGATQDAVIDSLRTLLSLLDSGVEYFISGLGNQVYIAVKGDTETNSRYGVITAYRFEQLPAQFIGPAVDGGFSNQSHAVVYSNIELVLRRGLWLESPPGTLIAASTNNPAAEPYVEVLATNLGGDLDPVCRIEIVPTTRLYKNMIIGRRLYSRGSSFTSLIYLSDTGQPSGITVTATGNEAVFIDTGFTAAGRAVQCNPLTDYNSTGARVVIDSSISPSFIGRFRAFVRVQRFGPVPAGHFVAKLSIGGEISEDAIYTYSEYQEVELNQSEGDWTFEAARTEILDFGVIELPPALPKTNSDIGDIAIDIWIKEWSTTSVTVGLFELALIPADESVVDMEIGLDPYFSWTDGFGTIILDKITSPEEPMDIYIEHDNGIGHIPVYGGSESLSIAKERCRLWFYAYSRMRDIYDGTNIHYNARDGLPTVIWPTTVYKLNRYLLPRGND